MTLQRTVWLRAFAGCPDVLHHSWLASKRAARCPPSTACWPPGAAPRLAAGHAQHQGFCLRGLDVINPWNRLRDNVWYDGWAMVLRDRYRITATVAPSKNRSGCFYGLFTEWRRRHRRGPLAMLFSAMELCWTKSTRPSIGAVCKASSSLTLLRIEFPLSHAMIDLASIH
jgi:hypothetical protein